MISFTCEHCSRRVTFADHWAGKQSNCPHCQKPISVPSAEELDLDDLELAPAEVDATSKTDILPAQKSHDTHIESSQVPGPETTEESWVRTYRLRRARQRERTQSYRLLVVTLVIAAVAVAVVAMFYLLL